MKADALGTFFGVLIWSFAAAAVAASLTTDLEGLRVEVKSDPEQPVRHRKTIYTVRLVDSGGARVTDARVTLTARMADGMSAAAPLRQTGERGIYRGEVLFTMEGPWDARVRVVSRGRRLELPLREEVGR